MISIEQNIVEELEVLREKIIGEIRSLVSLVGDELYIHDIDEGCSPILCSGVLDVDTFTLDKISINDDELIFDGSSSWDNNFWTSEQLGVEHLAGILVFLQEHRYEIEELWTRVC